MNRLEDLGEVDRPHAGDEVVVDAGRGDVLDVEVADLTGQLADLGGDVLAHAIRVADVEVEADGRRADAVGDFQVFVGRLDQQTRLRLDEQADAAVLGVLGQRLQHLDEQIHRRLAGLAGRDGAARLGRDVRRAQLGAEGKRPTRVVDANTAIAFVRLDERRVPIRLTVVGDRVHHEGVDIGECQFFAIHGSA